MYKRGYFTLLPGLDGTRYTYPVALNDRGDVIGFAGDDTDDPDGVERRVFWPTHRPGDLRELVGPPEVGLGDIDNRGIVIGSSFTDISRTYLWPRNGPIQPLPGPSGSLDFGAGSLRHGWVAGSENMSTPDEARSLS